MKQSRIRCPWCESTGVTVKGTDPGGLRWYEPCRLCRPLSPKRVYPDKE